MPDPKDFFIPMPGLGGVSVASPAAPTSPSTTGDVVPAEPLADGERGKLARTGVKRDNDYLFFIKNVDGCATVWRVARKKPGGAEAEAELVARSSAKMVVGDYLYYVDGDGDIARTPRKAAVSSSRDDDDGDDDDE